MRLARRELDAGADGLRTVAASFARLGAVSHGFGRRRHDRGNKVMLQYRDPAAGLLCLERVLVELIECRSEEHTSELQSLMRMSYAVFCLKKKKKKQSNT